MKQRFVHLLFILILGSVSAALLLGVRSYTMPRIERYKEIMLRSTILRAAGIEYEDGKLDEAFRRNIKSAEKGNFVYYLSPDGLYIFEFEGRGLWGMIKGTITLHPDLKTIENIQIISQEETPGLGGRIVEKSFLGQFRQKKIFPKLYLTLRQKASRDNEIDSITGASMTSKALISMINDAVKDFRVTAEEKNAYR